MILSVVFFLAPFLKFTTANTFLHNSRVWHVANAFSFYQMLPVGRYLTFCTEDSLRKFRVPFFHMRSSVVTRYCLAESKCISFYTALVKLFYLKPLCSWGYLHNAQHWTNGLEKKLPSFGEVPLIFVRLEANFFPAPSHSHSRIFRIVCWLQGMDQFMKSKNVCTCGILSLHRKNILQMLSVFYFY